MLLRGPGQRLHLVLGSPWRLALAHYRADGVRVEGLWAIPDEFERGDLLLTVLDTRPRVLLCLERARERSRPDEWIWVEEEHETFDPLVPVPALVGRLGYRLPPAPRTLPDAMADDVLHHLAEVIKHPTDWSVSEGTRSCSNSRARSSGLQAYVLAAADGRCAACDRDYGSLLEGQGLVGLEVHHLDSLVSAGTEHVRTAPGRLAALCGGCHRVVHHEPDPPTINDLRQAWQAADHPGKLPVRWPRRASRGQQEPGLLP